MGSRRGAGAAAKRLIPVSAAGAATVAPESGQIAAARQASCGTTADDLEKAISSARKP
ncbi:hypothetical protein LHGZ1_1906 [Laribacter hongkongensis]|uniref:Uncharacterized protein n=1 Tax=Laribacter hongkongensis TaxID=168471 RepID=A0A248LJ03_9NEIS|nr:hypothetical protein LHGZ1_1906 [Laribacter hongkongensis]